MVESKKDGSFLHDRPGILLVGSPSVGKRTLLHRLLSSAASFDPAYEDFNADELSYGWRIENKYYKADLTLWNVNLEDSFLISSLPCSRRIAALVLVFDVSKPDSLTAIQNWVSTIDLTQFEILLCIANKIDLLPSHPSSNLYSETTSLLSNNDLDNDSLISSSREWCADRSFELIEACALNPDFDKGLSIDGDSQGVERIICALSAHTWPGLVMNSCHQTAPFRSGSESSEEEIDYDFEYEVLTEGAGEPEDDGAFGAWVGNGSTSRETLRESEETGFETEDIEAIMAEIGNAREKVRFLPDFERREMAANIAFKMAALLGASTDDEDDTLAS